MSEQLSPSRPSQGRILVVDDELSIRKPIRIALLQAGYEVVEATDGQEAIDALGDGDNPLLVDAILCDIRMPRINGIDAIQFFRSHYPSIPVIVLTGYPDCDLAVTLMKMGVRDYLVKPVAKQDLLRVLKGAVDTHTLFKDQFVA
ncbi:MAG: putative Response regulator, CheY-like [Nitrospira sp.]|jgi:two-component system chemotaxis response regulator CheY|nr:putative Response regulator, CheY-like [Nitrospira sp.]